MLKDIVKEKILALPLAKINRKVIKIKSSVCGKFHFFIVSQEVMQKETHNLKIKIAIR